MAKVTSALLVRSMTKKKGWVEPEKPVAARPPKQEVKKMVPDTNELFNLFDRRNKGERISKTQAELETVKKADEVRRS